MKLAIYDDFRIGVVNAGSVRGITGVLPAALDVVPVERMNWLVAHWSDLAGAVETYDCAQLSLASVRLRGCSPSPGTCSRCPATTARTWVRSAR
jgi:hypothetical protein